MYVLFALQPDSINVFPFEWGKIQEGEYWRCASFIFVPPIMAGGFLGALFMFFVLMISFLMSDSLESAWGPFRTSTYCYAVFGCQLAANITLAQMGYTGRIGWGGLLFYEAIFFAFATLFPRYEFRLMLLFPVPVFVLAIINAVFALLFTIGSPPLMLYGLICFLPYLAWAVPMLVSSYRHRTDTARRQASFRAKAAPAGEAFHRCENCGATEATHPGRDFRVTADGGELCSACMTGKGDAGKGDGDAS